MIKTALLVACVVIASSGTAFANQNEEDVAGTFTTQIVPCASLCTHSIYSGNLVGTSDFTLISLEGTADPNVVRYTGNLVVHTSSGDLVGTDVGLWNTSTGNYTDTYQVTSGTGIYVQATAVLLLRGTLDAVTGTGSSTYRGTIVFPDSH